MDNIIKQIFAQAKQLDCCDKFKGTEDLQGIINLFKSPQGLEFCIKNHFPRISTLRLFRPYKVERYGIYIDAGEIINVNSEISKLLDCVCVNDVINNISAELTYSQRRVLRLWSKGNTQETIAKKLRVKQQTISKHQQSIRDIGKRLYPEGIDF